MKKTARKMISLLLAAFSLTLVLGMGASAKDYTQKAEQT